MNGIRPTSSQGGNYRLPTEADWEYAARVGTQTVYGFSDDAGKLGDYAWHEENSEEQTHPVGQKQPNVWGLYDMHGNVGEWCQDWFDSAYYAQSPTEHPQGPASGSRRVTRGGGFLTTAAHTRLANRGNWRPDDHYSSIGFRLLKMPE